MMDKRSLLLIADAFYPGEIPPRMHWTPTTFPKILLGGNSPAARKSIDL